MDDARPELGPEDQQHLQLLEIGYYVLAALAALGAAAALFFFGAGTVVAAVAESTAERAEPPLHVLSAFLGLLGFSIFAVSVAVAAAYFYTARFVRQRRRRVFCLVVAGLTAMNAPLGTLVGVFTFIVLARPSVAAAFDD